jgi:hypothetical protein
MKKSTLSLLLCMLALISGNMIAQNLSDKINQQLTQLLENDQLMAQDVQWELSSNHVSSVSGVHHIYYSQMVNDIEVYGTQSSVHVLNNGEVLSANNKFIFKTIDKLSGLNASLTAIQAVQAAADQLNYTITDAIAVLENYGGPSQRQILSDGGMSLSPIPAKLMYQLIDNKFILVWDISIQEKSQQDWWNVRIDASSGNIVDQNNYMLSCAFEHNHNEGLNFNKNLFDIPNYTENLASAEAGCGGCYEVIAMPIESPYYGARSTEIQPAFIGASPFGWHDTDGVSGADFTVTKGNNVDAYEDGNNPGYQPDGGATLDFTGYPFDPIYTNANQYEDAAITNLFYWNNIVHDLLYVYGFDEVGGNFQENNYGNGAIGNDSVNAEAQDGSGTCNANFGTPPDGDNPRMQMYICDDKDGDFDNLVIVHEYGHGLSNRLTGGPGNTGCLNNGEQMGEGWSDFYGVLMTIEAGDAGTDARAVGTYLFGQGPGGAGIRPFPYSTDLAVNPQTYGDICGAAVPHGVGSVWATMLWEVTWALIDEHGFDEDFYNFTGDVNQDAGNIQAFALVTEGMKLQACSPSFIDGRDAIFAADLAIYGGANECLLWDAFAKRGLGFSADAGGSGNTCDGTEMFDSPVPAISTEEEVCEGQGIQTYGGGTPVGGVYSGPGVTDDGNGLTYTFDPTVAGIGMHTIDYNVTTQCATGAASDTIEVTDNIPELTCQDITLELDANGEAILEIPAVVTNLELGALVIDQTGTFAPLDIATTGTNVILGDDDMSGALPIGFSFNFYDADYTNFFISSNGFITFTGGQDDGCCTGGLLPTSNDENNLIALVWEDLDPDGGNDGTIRYATVGVAPDRILVMEYVDVPYWGSSNSVTTQLQLFEGTNRIEIHSTDIAADGSATQGVENASGTEGLATPGRNSQVWSASNDYVAFYYQPGGPADNCGLTTSIDLSQTLFTCADLGSNIVTITVTDTDGNSTSCTSSVTITDPLAVCILGVEENELDNAISLFPNPTIGAITLFNNSKVDIQAVTILDINGRTIQQLDIEGAAASTNFSVASLARGMYFVKIETDTASIVKRIVKN